jgi:hypothetical protein
MWSSGATDGATCRILARLAALSAGGVGKRDQVLTSGSLVTEDGAETAPASLHDDARWRWLLRAVLQRGEEGCGAISDGLSFYGVQGRCSSGWAALAVSRGGGLARQWQWCRWRGSGKGKARARTREGPMAFYRQRSLRLEATTGRGGGRRGQGPTRLTQDNATHAGVRDSTACWLGRRAVSGRGLVRARTPMYGKVPCGALWRGSAAS